MSKLRRTALVLIGLFGVSACQQASTTVEIDLPSKIDFSDGFQQSDANAIVAKCGAKDVELKVKPDGEIAFVPSPDADYEAAACVLKYIKESGATKFGFVGNEKFVTPEEGQ